MGGVLINEDRKVLWKMGCLLKVSGHLVRSWGRAWWEQVVRAWRESVGRSSLMECVVFDRIAWDQCTEYLVNADWISMGSR
jgi:hypothetical protein